MIDEYSASIIAKSQIATGSIKGCYVYMGVVDGVIQYIGKGSKDRYKHLNNGKSQIPNVLEFSLSGGVFDVYILCDYLTHESALTLEKSAIATLNPLMNKAYRTNTLVSQ